MSPGDALPTQRQPGPAPSGSTARRQFVAVLSVGAVVLAGGVAWRMLRAKPETLFRQAGALSLRDPQRARGLLETAIRRAGGSYPDAERELCRIAADQGDWATALTRFENFAVADCPPTFLLEFGELALNARQTPQALAALDEVRRRHGAESLAALNLLQSHYRSQHQESRLLDCAWELARLQPELPALWWKLLEMLDIRQLDSQYLEALHEALRQQLPPRDKAELQHRLVARLVDQGNVDEAEQTLAEIIARDGRTARVRMHQAAIARLRGDATTALELVTGALGEAGENPGAVRLRALIEFDLGEYAAAARDFEKGVAADPYDLISHFKAAEAYRRLGDSAAAQGHAEQARQIRVKRQRINQLREQTRNSPTDPRILEELAQLHRDLQDLRGAEFWQTQAREASGQPDKR